MPKQITGKSVAKNISLSVMVQAISLIVGFVMNLIVPKFIDEYQYSYWQTFLLYSQYIGMLHLGLIDGIVLRYSQYDYNELDKKAVRSQYTAIMCFNAIVSIGMTTVALVFLSGFSRIIVVLLALSVIPVISFNYVSFTFQITNRINRYAQYVMIDRCLYCGIIIAFLIFKIEHAYWYCIAYIIARVISIVTFGVKYNRQLFFGKLLPVKETKVELKETLSAGIWLMIASYSANFIVGFGKMVVQWRWDALIFGKVSLAFSLTGFVLQFVTAVSIVLFPSLKRLDPEKLPNLYKTIRNAISPILLFSLVLYYPGSIILELWLPKYATSIVYLGLLMPIIVYTSKVSLLTNNYLKAYRKEKALLAINLSMVAFSLVMFLIIAYWVNNLQLLLVAVVAAIMIRSIVSEIAVARIIKINIVSDFILEFVITAIFIISTIYFDRLMGFLIYSVVLAIYFAIKRNSIAKLLRQVKSIKLHTK